MTPLIHIILLEPRIPQNTGNIGRLCLAAGCRLHLIHPLGFSLTQKEIKRSGMDYWKDVDVCEWEDLEEFWACHPFCHRHFLLSTKAQKIYFQAPFAGKEPCFLYFGREDGGLPEWLLDKYFDQTYKIPMQEGVRSLNLATSAGAVLYEAIRQIGCKRVFKAAPALF